LIERTPAKDLVAAASQLEPRDMANLVADFSAEVREKVLNKEGDSRLEAALSVVICCKFKSEWSCGLCDGISLSHCVVLAKEYEKIRYLLQFPVPDNNIKCLALKMSSKTVY
jgi:hypothetical protein